MDKDVQPLGELVFASNPSCFRVVRVFRGSICFFQVESLFTEVPEAAFIFA